MYDECFHTLIHQRYLHLFGGKFRLMVGWQNFAFDISFDDAKYNLLYI